MVRYTRPLLGFLMLAACVQTPREAAMPAPAPTSDGRVAIARNQSQVSIAGDDRFVSQRHVRRLSDRYDEVLTFDDGMIEYQKFNAGRSGEDADGRVTIQRLLATDTYQQLGLPAKAPGFKVGRNRNGEFDYTIVDGTDLRCVLVSQFFGVAMPGGGRTQEFRLTRCRPLDAPNLATLEPDVIDLVGRLTFDGGALNRARVPEARLLR